jgi:hypothetical protein
MRQRTAITAEMMLRHPSLVKAEFFYFDNLVEYLPIKVRERAFNIRHVSR